MICMCDFHRRPQTSHVVGDQTMQWLGSVFGRTDFSLIFIFGPTDFIADFVAGFFLLILVGKSAQKNTPGKSPAKSSKCFQKSPTRFCRGAGPTMPYCDSGCGKSPALCHFKLRFPGRLSFFLCLAMQVLPEDHCKEDPCNSDRMGSWRGIDQELTNY